MCWLSHSVAIVVCYDIMQVCNSFPTRRSSDLGDGSLGHHRGRPGAPVDEGDLSEEVAGKQSERRSEEHTSELQSLTNLVCRLLLEKKKPKARQGRLTLHSRFATGKRFES